jgi:osmoprotectant transport system ATP-binding protein
VTLFGAPLEYADVYTARLKMGYVVQDSALFPHITVGRNISLPGAISGQSSIEQERRVRALLETVQLPEVYAAKYPHELSGGEQQRVSLCRAMFLDPPVLLMDEPFSSLDYGTKHALYRHFKDLQAAAPRTVILVTHDWDEAQTLGDAFLWIDRGRIRAHGRMEDLAQLKGEYLASI